MRNGVRGWIEKRKQNIAAKSILLNLAYLSGMLLFFVPFFSIDDYLMSNIVYGVYGADYDYQITYMNFLYGRLIVFLLRLFPRIPWYTVLFYIWIFAALTLLTYVILKWSDNFAGMLLANLLLLFFSYEGYVAIQFTKVAGMTGAVAVLVLMSDKISWKPKIFGIGLWILTCMIRMDCARMAFGVWCLLLGWNVWETFWKNKKILLKEYVRRGGFFLLGACIFFTAPKFSLLGMTGEEKDFWKLYWAHNEIRSGMQDYPVPDYEKNKETYEALGISENDLYLFTSWNWDCDVMTLEKGAIIQAMREGDDEKTEALLADYLTEKKTIPLLRQSVLDIGSALVPLLKKVFDIHTVTGFFKVFPKALLKIDVCTVYFLIMLITPLCWNVRGKESIRAVLLSGGTLFLLNYYLYMDSRYLLHRVDVGVTFMAITVFLVLITEKEYSLSERVGGRGMAFGVLTLLMLDGTYFWYYGDYQTPDSQTIRQNQMFYEEAAADTNHCYLLGYCREMGGDIQVFYEALDVPEIGAAKNVIRGNFIWNLLKMDRLFTNIVDSNEMYFALWDGDGNEASWNRYFTEHGDAETRLAPVRQYLGKTIYCIRALPLKETVDLPKWNEMSRQIKGNIECSISENSLTISGTAYTEGNTGFSQRAYIQIVDSRTGEYELYDTFTVCDETKNYGDEGYFAKISAEIELPDFYNRSTRINLLIEQDGDFYYKCIRPTE